jgi:hypothetical protein
VTGEGLHEDVIVYAHHGGHDYVALFGADGWWRWPAVADGWLSRRGCSATLADGCEELEPKLAALALRLSGVTT